MRPISAAAAVLALVASSSSARAQGVLPLSGTYAFGEIEGRYDPGCVGPFQPGVVFIGNRGTVSFLPAGTFSISGTGTTICAAGGAAPGAFAGSGTYSVGTDGRLTINFTSPAVATTVAHLRPDAQSSSCLARRPSRVPTSSWP